MDDTFCKDVVCSDKQIKWGVSLFLISEHITSHYLCIYSKQGVYYLTNITVLDV